MRVLVVARTHMHQMACIGGLDLSTNRGVRSLKCVGYAPPIDLIPAGALVRVSLARWWRPPDATDMEPRCYLQLSGWYL